MDRRKPRPGRGDRKRGEADVGGRDSRQHGCCRGPQTRQSSSPGKQPAVFTPTWKSASGRIDPHVWPFSGLAWTSWFSQSDKRAGDAKSRIRPKPRLRSGAGLMLRDVTPSNMAATGFPRLGQVRLMGSNHQSSHPLGSLLRGGWTPTRGPFRTKSGRAGTANPTPGPGMLVSWLDTSPGREEGPGRGAGQMFGDVTPGNMAAAGVPRLGQVRLLGSNQQSSRPFGRLLRGGWTPTPGPFRD